MKKQPKKAVTVRLPLELIEELKEKAEKNKRSFSNQVLIELDD